MHDVTACEHVAKVQDALMDLLEAHGQPRPLMIVKGIAVFEVAVADDAEARLATVLLGPGTHWDVLGVLNTASAIQEGVIRRTSNRGQR